MGVGDLGWGWGVGVGVGVGDSSQVNTVFELGSWAGVDSALSKQRTGSNFQPVCRATFGHSLSKRSMSGLFPLITNHHFLVVPFWEFLNFRLMEKLGPREEGVVCLMALITTVVDVDLRVPQTFLQFSTGTHFLVGWGA